jgi:hypothetical protein
LIKPWTTCLRLIRAVTSITWPGSTAEVAVPATGAVVVLYVDEKLQARRWNGLSRCCRCGRASLKAQPRLHPAWATTSFDALKAAMSAAGPVTDACYPITGTRNSVL